MWNLVQTMNEQNNEKTKVMISTTVVKFFLTNDPKSSSLKMVLSEMGISYWTGNCRQLPEKETNMKRVSVCRLKSGQLTGQPLCVWVREINSIYKKNCILIQLNLTLYKECFSESCYDWSMNLRNVFLFKL